MTEREWELPAKELKGSQPHRVEADHLSARILARAPTNDDVSAEFIEHRFRFPLINYRRRSTIAAGSHIAINVFTALGSLASAAIVAAGAGEEGALKVFVIAVGVAVGLLSGLNQVLRPGQRNLVYARTWMQLRSEGWEYVRGLGDYAPKSPTGQETHPSEAWALFTSRVIGVQREAEAVGEPGGDNAVNPQQ